MNISSFGGQREENLKLGVLSGVFGMEKVRRTCFTSKLEGRAARLLILQEGQSTSPGGNVYVTSVEEAG